MAESQKNKPEVFAEVVRSGSTIVRLEKTVYKGETILCLREYFLKNGDWIPTRRGVNLKVGNWRSVILPALQEALSGR